LPAAAASVIVDRFLDLGFVILVGGMALASPLLSAQERLVVVSTLLVLVVLVLSLLWATVRGGLEAAVRWAARFLFRERSAERWTEGVGDLGTSISIYSARSLLVPGLLTCAIWGIYVLLNLCLVGALRIQVPAGYLLLVLAIVALAGSLPVSIGGLGTREAILILFLGRIGVSAERAVAYGILEAFLLYVVTGAVALPAWRLILSRSRSLSPVQPRPWI
jgi:uncharacterized protein (TIRG00374 family)